MKRLISGFIAILFYTSLFTLIFPFEVLCSDIIIVNRIRATTGGGPSYSYYGYSSYPSLPANELSDTADLTFVRTETITGNCTAVSVFIAVGQGWAVNNAWAVLYKFDGGTGYDLIGKGLINSPSTSAWNEVTLIVEDGESLSLVTSDVVRFGYAVDPSGTFYYLRDNAGGAGGHYNAGDVSAGPITPISSWSFSTDRDMGFRLKVTP